MRVTRRHFLACGRGPSYQPLHVQSTLDACRSLTTLTTPRQEHQGGGRRRGLGRGRRGAGEDAAVDAHTERSTRVHWFGCGVGLLATIHAADVGELLEKPLYRQLLEDRVFRLAVCIRCVDGERSYEVEELP